jgi:hypothetical protein
MAEADLDAVIRQTAKAQGKTLMEAAKRRHAGYLAKAANAKDKDARARLKLMAKSTMEHATATARRLRMSAENAADSYARAMKKTLDEAAKKPAKKKNSDIAIARR